ncbi:MAG: hypothetical protein ACRC5C_03580 [Bacilli bacterium]
MKRNFFIAGALLGAVGVLAYDGIKRTLEPAPAEQIIKNLKETLRETHAVRDGWIAHTPEQTAWGYAYVGEIEMSDEHEHLIATPTFHRHTFYVCPYSQSLLHIEKAASDV